MFQILVQILVQIKSRISETKEQIQGKIATTHRLVSSQGHSARVMASTLLWVAILS